MPYKGEDLTQAGNLQLQQHITVLGKQLEQLNKNVLGTRPFISVPRGGVCTLINISCCMYVNEAGRIEADLKNIWEKTKILHKVVQADTSWV